MHLRQAAFGSPTIRHAWHTRIMGGKETFLMNVQVNRLAGTKASRRSQFVSEFFDVLERFLAKGFFNLEFVWVPLVMKTRLS